MYSHIKLCIHTNINKILGTRLAMYTCALFVSKGFRLGVLYYLFYAVENNDCFESTKKSKIK